MDASGLSQTAVAERLGVSKEAVSQWLKEKSFPCPNKLLQFAKLLQLSFSELVINEEDDDPLIAFRKKRQFENYKYSCWESEGERTVFEASCPVLALWYSWNAASS
jgi:transcriptional regulator with XRE-family HTH domain